MTPESFGIHGLPLFAAAALLVNLTPGPDMLFVIGTSAARGRRDGVFAALGVGLGCMLHIALAALGLSALLAASATAFAVVKWIGAAYLIWTGVTMLRAAGRPATEVAREAAIGVADAGLPGSARAARAFWQGAVTNALNPKVALFFLAFLPQFIAPGHDGQALAFVVLGLLFNAGGAVVNIGVALLAGAARDRWAGSAGSGRVGAWLRRAAGALFVALGVKLAFSSR
jgi:threonine/homoserine/homoserine lactone efflux protein